MANIKYPKNDFKIEDTYNLPLEIEAADDFGLNKIELEYYKINKPYYLEQDTIL